MYYNVMYSVSSLLFRMISLYYSCYCINVRKTTLQQSKIVKSTIRTGKLCMVKYQQVKASYMFEFFSCVSIISHLKEYESELCCVDQEACCSPIIVLLCIDVTEGRL